MISFSGTGKPKVAVSQKVISHQTLLETLYDCCVLSRDHVRYIFTGNIVVTSKEHN